MTDKAKKYLSDIQYAYDNIDNAIVWTITKNHLPILKTEIENILNS